MPRNPESLPVGIRISDRITQAQIHRFYPEPVVKKCLESVNRQGIRNRALPNFFVVYYSIMLCLYRSASQKEVLRCMADGLYWLFGLAECTITGKSGISQARTRIGWEPMRAVFEACSKPVAEPDSAGSFYKGLRVVVIDGSDLDLDDCPENREFFGSSKNQNGEGSNPKARIVALMEAGTRLIFAMAWGPFQNSSSDNESSKTQSKPRYTVHLVDKKVSENALSKEVIPYLKPGMLCLADMLFMDYEIFESAHQTGAELLFRARLDRILPKERVLPDGSYESTICSSYDRKRKMKVRVLEFEIKITVNGKTTQARYRLITTLMDSEKYPLEELAMLYRERWEVETMLDEMKIHLMNNMPLRSRTPDLVVQEIYAMAMAFNVIRLAMYEAASSIPIDPDLLSFTHSKNVIVRNLTKVGAFSP